jgi:excisionase family DNA binding protein
MSVVKADPTVEKLMLTPADAAVALSVSRTTVYELMNRGQLRSVKLGTCRRIPIEAVRDLIEQLAEEQVHDIHVTPPE